MDSLDNPTKDNLASRITRAASHQTYNTVRFLVDRSRRPSAFHAYAYFRWLDDCLDTKLNCDIGRMEFIHKQKSLMEGLYRGERYNPSSAEENMLVELIQGDTEHNSGLRSYIENMMDVMSFDSRRRWRPITHRELSNYTRQLATAVTEALHYFIGHDTPAFQDGRRYHCAAAAHITHMLRDTAEDINAGYFNIPESYLRRYEMDHSDFHSPGYRTWVKNRVELARRYFQAGKEYLAKVGNLRCRLAGFAYAARFELLLDAIEQDGYDLRTTYEEWSGPFDMAFVSTSALLQALHHQVPGKRLQIRTTQ